MHNPKHKNISIIEYIARNNTDEARRFIVKYGQLPAKNGKELETRMAYVMKKFGDEAMKDLARIHPDRNLILDYKNMTGEQLNDGYSYNAMCPSCGSDHFACDGKKECKCKCKDKDKDEKSNFITNYRDDGMQYATGERMTEEASKRAEKIKKGLAGVAIVGGFLVLLALASSGGEKFRAY